MIDIYYAINKSQLDQPIFDKLLSILPLKMRQKILSYRRWQDAQASLFGKLLVDRRINELGLTHNLKNIKYNEFGRPYLEGFLDFNISHAGHYVVCAFSSHTNVGIDLEEIKPITFLDFLNEFTPHEWRQIENSKKKLAAFYENWTAKEATIKAKGLGLTISPIDVQINENKAFIKQETWYLKKVDLSKNYFLHVASSREIKKIHLKEINF